MWKRFGFFTDGRDRNYSLIFRDSFSVRIKTDNTGGTGNTEYELPIRSSYSGNVALFQGDVTYIDWGDGTVERYITDYSNFPTHTYASAGEYNIKFKYMKPSGTNLGLRFDPTNGQDPQKLINFISWGSGQPWTQLDNFFKDCSQMEYLAQDAPPSDLTSINNMFENCTTITGNEYINNWTNAFTSVTSAFENATNFNADLDQWDISNVSTLDSTFKSASSFNGNISTWDTSNVTNMDDVFYGASAFNSDIGSWDMSNCNIFNNTFRSASSFNQDIGSWTIKSTGVGSGDSMFRDASSFNQDIGGWATNALQYDMFNMFDGATVFNQDLSGWCVNLLSNAPSGFDANCPAWVLPRPVWGTCP